MQDLEGVIAFLIEAEKLKAIHRKTKPVGLDRFENSAEHSWHVCLCALMLREYANEETDINKVLKMMLLHDLGEIDAGDTIIYKAETSEIKQKELNGVRRLLAFLPPDQAKEYEELWLEFEHGETAEAQYARAIDRLPPVLQNLNGNGHSWREHNISLEQVLSVNSRIGKGSNELWQLIESRIKEAAEQGIFAG